MPVTSRRGGSRGRQGGCQPQPANPDGAAGQAGVWGSSLAGIAKTGDAPHGLQRRPAVFPAEGGGFDAHPLASPPAQAEQAIGHGDGYG
ncbi:MAG: hypothetical protein KC415_05565 [Anaerolineales bacterium]|nr:hypothetical protein [Anaerolineales bacterium]